MAEAPIVENPQREYEAQHRKPHIPRHLRSDILEPPARITRHLTLKGLPPGEPEGKVDVPTADALKAATVKLSQIQPVPKPSREALALRVAGAVKDIGDASSELGRELTSRERALLITRTLTAAEVVAAAQAKDPTQGTTVEFPKPKLT